MIYNQAKQISDTHLLPQIAELYGFVGCAVTPINPHEGGRNLVYACVKDSVSRIVRVSFLNDRSREDFLAETEYVRYLHEHGGSVSNVVDSLYGNMVEEIIHDNHTYYVCVFEKAKGKQLAENGYQYRDGVPISEYYYNCGKTLGKLHRLSKEYAPAHKRNSFLDVFNGEYIDKLIPDSMATLKASLTKLLYDLDGLSKNGEMYGMLHFDFSDGNFNIDFETGEITVYDFDNSCYGWYLYDLANLWTHGVGWIQHEPNTEKRKVFMDDYFNTVVEGYRSETALADSTLSQLPLLIQAVLMENIVDEFEVARNNGEDVELDDEELLYIIKCLTNNIPYKGFFSEIYSCESPFKYEE